MSKKELNNNQKLALNLGASFMTYIVTFGINFFLSPYIVRTVGVDAYGFVGLANNFISYASLITVAVNALAGRFVTIKIHQKDYEGANRYYTSVFFANLLLSFVLLIAALAIWIPLEHIINIPDNIFWDVKILFAVLFINCILGTVGSVFGVSTFATNKLYLTSVRNIESSVARAIVLVVLYAFCAPKVSYLGLTTLLTGIYAIVFNMYYTRKLTPFLHIRRKYFDFKSIIELVSSGVWNLVNRLGQLLTDGLDLLITNLFIDPTAMGVLSLAKTVPGVITSIVGTMVGSFSPNFTEYYAKGEMDKLKESLKQSMKIMGIICNLPIIVLIVCGERFFALWQPTQDAKQLQVLSILTVAGLIVNGGINCVYNIFTVVNKLKFNALVLLFSSILSVGVTFVCLKFTDLGIYAVAGVSTVIMIIKNVALIVPYAAKCLNLKWYTFYPDVIRPVLFVVVSCFGCYFVNKAIPIEGWLGLIITAAIVVIVSAVIGWIAILQKDDREHFIQLIKRKLVRK